MKTELIIIIVSLALILISNLAICLVLYGQKKRIDGLYDRKPEIDIEKYPDGMAWFDKEGNMINSTSKTAKKK